METSVLRRMTDRLERIRLSVLLTWPHHVGIHSNQPRQEWCHMPHNSITLSIEWFLAIKISPVPQQWSSGVEQHEGITRDPTDAAGQIPERSILKTED